MRPRTADFRWIQTLYLTPDPLAGPTEECPQLDDLRAAAAAQLPPKKRREILDHAMGCPYCLESWQLALKLGARPAVAFWSQGFGIFWEDLMFVAGLPQRLWRTLSAIGGWKPIPIIAAALLASVIVVKFGPFSSPQAAPAPTESSLRSHQIPEITAMSQHDRIESGLARVDSLDRESFILQWSGTPGATYHFRLTTVSGDPLHTARDLKATDYRVPPEVLRHLKPGTRLFWQVSSGTSAENPPPFEIRIR